MHIFMSIYVYVCKYVYSYVYIYIYLYIFIMAPKGGHIVISVSVIPSVCHRLTLLMGCSLCSLLLRNYSTDFSNDTNQLRDVDVQHALHFDLDPSMTAGQGHEILRFCELFLLTCSTGPIPPMMIPIN